MAQPDDPISDRTPASSRRGQAIRAAHKSGEWADVLDEVEAVHATRAVDEAAIADEAFDTMIATISAVPPPSSSKTPVGMFGPPTDPVIRTLDPRQPSIEATRLDLFAAPPVAAPRASDPRSYRTRVGLYFVPREPATEPTLPDMTGDDTSVTRRSAPLHRARRDGPLARAAAWLRRCFGARR